MKHLVIGFFAFFMVPFRSTCMVASNTCIDNIFSLSEVEDNTCTSSSCPFQGGNSPSLRLYPTMRISCSGTIQTVTVAGEDGARSGQAQANLQIWRMASPDTYIRKSVVEFPNITSVTNPGSYVTFPVTIQVRVQADDIIGLLIPRNHRNHADFRVYTSTDSDLNYVVSDVHADMFTLPATSTDTGRPFIHLDILPDEVPTVPGAVLGQTTMTTTEEEPTSAAMTTQELTTITTREETTMPVTTSGLATTQWSTLITTEATLPTERMLVEDFGDAPTQTSIDSEAQNGTTIGGAVGGAIGSIIAIILVVLTVSVLIFLRRRKDQVSVSEKGYIISPQYRNDLEMRKFEFKMDIPNPTSIDMDDCGTYSLAGEAHYYDYAVVNDYHNSPTTAEYSTLEDPRAPGYEMPAIINKEAPALSWSLVVPSWEQRDKVSSLNSQEAYYRLSQLDLENMSRESNYFEESEVYWEPSSIVYELYEQLSKNKYREIRRDQIQIEQFLGSGAFGTVNKGIWQSPGGDFEVAIKTNQEKDENETVKFLQEAAIMGQFIHPNVVRLYGVVTVGEPVMIILELLSNGDLKEFLEKMQPKQGEMVAADTQKILLKFCQQISSGMEYLSRKSFIHRDLAARNILVSEDRVCKISDFGMSRNLLEEDYYMSQGGKIPVKWTAPEALHYKKYSTASDVWSFGCVMYEIWSLGHKPFEALTNIEAVRQIEKGRRLAPPPGCPRELYRIMIKCWNPEAKSRPCFSHLVEVLSQADFELLLWSEKDRRVGPQVAFIGAPLEMAKKLYLDLQCTYLK